MPEVWPGSVNAFAIRDSYNEEPQRNVVETAPETGPVLSRRRSSTAVELVNYEGRYTSVEWATLKTFYVTTLQHGVLAFTLTNPFDGVSGLYKFAAAPKIIGRVGALKVRVPISLWKLP